MPPQRDDLERAPVQREQLAWGPRGVAVAESRVSALYDRWGLVVYRRALKLLGDPDEALDVKQEAFISLFQRLGQVENEAAALGLLHQSATFQAVDRLRRKSRWSSRLTQLKPLVCAEEGEEAHEREARQVEAAQDLALLTRGESPHALDAAVLHFVAGYTLEEVGEKLALSSRTVARMLARLGQRARKRRARLRVPVAGV